MLSGPVPKRNSNLNRLTAAALIRVLKVSRSSVDQPRQCCHMNFISTIPRLSTLRMRIKVWIDDKSIYRCPSRRCRKIWLWWSRHDAVALALTSHHPGKLVNEPERYGVDVWLSSLLISMASLRSMILKARVLSEVFHRHCHKG